MWPPKEITSYQGRQLSPLPDIISLEIDLCVVIKSAHQPCFFSLAHLFQPATAARAIRTYTSATLATPAHHSPLLYPTSEITETLTIRITQRIIIAILDQRIRILDLHTVHILPYDGDGQ